jgi:hypothetical protein
MVCLSCTGTGERVCLSAEGFGNRQCFLESIADRVRLFNPVLHSLTVIDKVPFCFLESIADHVRLFYFL